MVAGDVAPLSLHNVPEPDRYEIGKRPNGNMRNLRLRPYVNIIGVTLSKCPPGVMIAAGQNLKILLKSHREKSFSFFERLLS